MKKLLITGGREYGDRECVERALRKARSAGFGLLIAGGARGADSLAAEIGARLGFDVVVVRAEWERYGRGAGAIRNQVMADMKPDTCLAFPGGRGTADMVQRCRAAGIRVLSVRVRGTAPEPPVHLAGATYHWDRANRIHGSAIPDGARVELIGGWLGKRMGKWLIRYAGTVHTCCYRQITKGVRHG